MPWCTIYCILNECSQHTPLNSYEIMCDYICACLGVPGPVASLQYSTMLLGEASVSLLLTWEEPFSNYNPIDHYTVSGCTRTKSVTGITQCPNITVFPTVNGSIKNFHLNELSSNARYTFMVTAANSLGDGAVVSVSVSTMIMSTCKLKNTSLLSN